jgi:sterol desaturase/sphingolipid hydroxylase (fatty acid hydroxylase superfamily)
MIVEQDDTTKGKGRAQHPLQIAGRFVLAENGGDQGAIRCTHRGHNLEQFGVSSLPKLPRRGRLSRMIMFSRPQTSFPWSRVVDRIVGAIFAAVIAIPLVAWMWTHWAGVYPWLVVGALYLIVPLVFLWVAVRLVRHAWKG